MNSRCVSVLWAVLLAQHVGALIDLECWDVNNPQLYTGHTAVTRTGKKCQMWELQSPHEHEFGDDAADFIDGEFPSNYCRKPFDEDDPKPWCYTTDVNTRWEYCDIPICTCTGEFTVYGASCYAYVAENATWELAQANCNSFGGFLAEVMASDQNDFIHKLVLEQDGGEGSPPWLGGTGVGAGGHWTWATSGKAVEYTNWQMLRNDENCMMMMANMTGQWFDNSCLQPSTSVCQKSPSEVPNDERINELVNVVDMMQIAIEHLEDIVQNLTTTDNHFEIQLLESRHVEAGTFQCGTHNHWTQNPVQTHEIDFDTAYPMPPTVHLSLATLNTAVNQHMLGFSFTVENTTTSGFKVKCQDHVGRHYGKLQMLELTWISMPKLV